MIRLFFIGRIDAEAEAPILWPPDLDKFIPICGLIALLWKVEDKVLGAGERMWAAYYRDLVTGHRLTFWGQQNYGRSCESTAERSTVQDY